MLATMVDGFMKKIWDFRLAKMGKFGFFSIYSTHLKLSISKLIFHSESESESSGYVGH